jgi:hypothetical protein
MSVRAYRAAMLSGVAFALLLFFGVTCMFDSTPDTADKSADAVAQDYVTWISDGDNRAAVLVGCFLTILAAIALVWFASALRTRVAPGSTPLLGFALLAAGGVAAATLGPLALVGGHTFGDDPVPTDGNVIWMVLSLSFPALLAVFGLAVAAMIATTVYAGRRVLPMWLVVFGWIAVVAGVLGVMFIPMILVLLWFLAAGIYGAVRPEPAAPAPTPAA